MRAAFLLVFVGLVACGDDGGGSVSLDDAPSVFRAEYCRYLTRCGVVPDEAECAGLNIGFGSHVDPSLRAAIDAGKIKFNSAILGRCYHQIGSISCDRTDESARQFGGIACYGAILGTVDTGGQCAVDTECLSKMCDVPACPDACCQGTCIGVAVAPPPYQIGVACQTTSDCESGAYCDSTTDVCTALKPAGATCTSTNECPYGMGCAGLTGTRTCKTLPVVGEACPDGQCRDAGTYCTAAKACAKVGLPGDACATNGDCSSFYVCDGTQHCAQGAHEGESCAVNARCADYGNFCDNATKICKGLQPDGATCTSSSQCESVFCTGTTGAMICQVEPICI